MSSYVDNPESDGGKLPGGMSWDQMTRRRLRWLYGSDFEAQRRAMTQADIEAWNTLGRRGDAAA